MLSNTLDKKLLYYISKKQEISLDEILKKFPEKKYSTNARLQFLLTSQLITEMKEWQEHDIFPIIEVSLEKFSITDLGRKILLDHEKLIKSENFKTFKHSFLYPLSVAVLAAIATAYVTAVLTTHSIIGT